MANWCNARLIVVGLRPDVLRFSKHARARPSSIFEPDMLRGEGQDLFAERMETAGRGLSKKEYVFQVRNDDGRDHFRAISRRYQLLQLVLAYGDPNTGEYGSYLIQQGRSRAYVLPPDLIDSVMSKHGVDYDSDDDENEWRYREASWEAMDLAEMRWLQSILKKAAASSDHITSRKTMTQEPADPASDGVFIEVPSAEWARAHNVVEAIDMQSTPEEDATFIEFVKSLPKTPLDDEEYADDYTGDA